MLGQLGSIRSETKSRPSSSHVSTSIKLNPHEEEDLVHVEDLQGKRIDNAKKMQDMGYEVTLNEEKEFEFDPIDEPVEKPEPTFGGFGNGEPGEEQTPKEQKTPEASETSKKPETRTQPKPDDPPEPPKE